MQTAELFAACPTRSKAIAKGVAWLRTHRLMVESWAADLQLDLATVQAAIDTDLKGDRQSDSETASIEAADTSAEITIVIPCHNYAHYLRECLESIAASTLQPVRVIVIDDASNPESQPSQLELPHFKFRIDFHCVRYRSQALTCRYGFNLVETTYCLFLDADDKIHPDYLATAVQMLQADREAACAFPYLEAFGDGVGCCHQTDRAPDVVRWQDIESRNWCPAGSMFRSDILRQSLALQLDRVRGCGCSDWITIRTVLRSGPWHAVKTGVPLYYRQHATQMTKGSDFHRYELQANIANEVVTIVVAFSGRWEAWWKLRDWIRGNDWPVKQTRLMILNSTHRAVSANDLGLGDWGSSLQIERIDVGFPQLADQDRRGRADIQRQVDSAVAGLYNRAIAMAFGEWMLFCEDDVIPQRPDAIAQLFRSVGPQVAAVSAVYRGRYEPTAVAFGTPQNNRAHRDMTGPEIEHVISTGFGCLLARRSVLSRLGLSGDDPRCIWYDINCGVRVHHMGYQWILDRSVYCEHLV
jgi:glycosyltransferase involved in cell wall biosynthesis